MDHLESLRQQCLRACGPCEFPPKVTAYQRSRGTLLVYPGARVLHCPLRVWGCLL